VSGLCLERGLDEGVIIGEDIVITVVRIRGKRVKLLIEAPRTVHIDRFPEIYAVEGPDP
jgi:carbon storage regulator CsrA